MTYNVFGGTLNLALSINQSICSNESGLLMVNVWICLHSVLD